MFSNFLEKYIFSIFNISSLQSLLQIVSGLNIKKSFSLESLKDTYERVIEFYKNEIENNKGKSILISAHGNSIRALCKYLFILDNTQISKLEIPTGNPLLIEFENNKVTKCKYLHKERAKDLLVF